MKQKLFSFQILFFSLSFFLIVFYIIQVNATAIKGYQIHDLENYVANLKEKNRQLELSLTQVRSLEHISKDVSMLGLVKNETPLYLKADIPSFALGK
jgi:hypothetical protein